MTRIILDDPGMIATFDAAQSSTELCDATGRVIGVFVPCSTKTPAVYKGAKSPFTREELDRIYREEAKDAIPLSEFWERMRTKYPEKFQ